MSKEPTRNVYVGHRYVPKIMGEWDNSIDYEGLSIVTNQGTSYTSKKRVPVGIDILNTEFWVVTGNYNAQVEYYRQDVRDVQDNMTELDDRLTNDLINTRDYVDTEVAESKQYVDTEVAESKQYVDTEVAESKQYVHDNVDMKMNSADFDINIKDYGDFSDETFDSSIAFNNAINSASNGNSIYIPADIDYKIDNEIIINKKVSFYSNGQVRITARSTMNSMIRLTDQTVYTLGTIEGFELDGNNMADYCLMIDGGDQGGESYYAAVIKLNNMRVNKALKDGIIIIPPAWNITINNVMSLNNGRDGIRAVSESSSANGQINAISIDNSVILSNGNAGVNFNGTKHSISNSQIESNDYGILADMTDITYSLWGSSVTDCYIEHNRINQIKLVSKAELEMSVTNCLINGSLGDTNDVMIMCEGALDSITLSLENNSYVTGQANILNGNDTINYRSKITGVNKGNLQKFKNLGRSKVEWSDLKTTVIPISTATGLPAENNMRSENIIEQDVRRGRFFVSQDMTHKMLDRINMYVETDCDSAVVTVIMNEFDLSTGTQVRQTVYDTDITSNQLVSNNLVNNWGLTRVGQNNMITFDVQVNEYTGGTFVKIHNPYITYI